MVMGTPSMNLLEKNYQRNIGKKGQISFFNSQTFNFNITFIISFNGNVFAVPTAWIASLTAWSHFSFLFLFCFVLFCFVLTIIMDSTKEQ